jgi:hypothetical protein
MFEGQLEPSRLPMSESSATKIYPDISFYQTTNSCF